MSSSRTNPSLTRFRPSFPPLRLLVGQRLLKLFRSDALLFQEQFADTDGHWGNTQNITWAARPQPRAASSPPRVARASTQNPFTTATLAPPDNAGRASPAVLALTPARTPIRCALNQRSPPNATSRRSPSGGLLATEVGVDRDHPVLPSGPAGVGHDGHAEPRLSLQLPASVAFRRRGTTASSGSGWRVPGAGATHARAHPRPRPPAFATGRQSRRARRTRRPDGRQQDSASTAPPASRARSLPGQRRRRASARG